MEGPVNRLLRQREVAKMIGMSESWLEQSRHKKKGIPHLKIGRAVRYRASDVHDWIDNHVVSTGI